MPKSKLHKALFLFFALFAFSSTFSIALSQMSLGVALILFIIVCIKDNFNPFIKELKWFYIFTVLYLFWLVVASLVGPHPLTSLNMLREDWLFCIIFIAIYIVRDKKQRELLFKIFLVGVTLVVIYAIIQRYTGEHWFKSYHLKLVKEGYVRVAGNFSNPLTFANYFVVVAMFFLALGLGREKVVSLKERLVFLFVTGLALLAIVFTLSRGPLVLSLICILIYGLYFKRKFMIPALIVVALLLASVFIVPGMVERFTHHLRKDVDIHNEEGRSFIWYNAYTMVRDNPIFGISPNEFGPEYIRRVRPDMPQYYIYTHAHNDFLHIAAVSGIPGMLFFIGMWLSVLQLLWKTYRLKGLDPPERDLVGAVILGTLVFLMTSMIEATFLDEEVRALLMFLWGIGFSVLYNNRDKFAGRQTGGNPA